MKGKINGFDFYEDFLAQKYWSFPASWDKNKRETELNKILYSGDYIASEKKDGYFERIIKDDMGNMFMCSRNKGVNGVVEKYDWIPHMHDFFDALPNGTCLLGEVYLEGKTSKSVVSILGCLKEKAIERQADNENKLHFWIFDILAWDGRLIHSKPASERAKLLHSLLGNKDHDYVHVAQFWNNSKDINENWLNILENDGEGIVLVHRDYPYSFDKRTARKTLKLKKELSEPIDVFLTGRYREPTYLYTGKEIDTWPYWFNNITQTRFQGTLSDTSVDLGGFDAVTRLWFFNWAGSVEIAVMKNGQEIPIGFISGLTDEIREGIVSSNELYKHQVIEVDAMQIDRASNPPTLRHGKMIRFRDDKTPKDCDYSQLL